MQQAPYQQYSARSVNRQILILVYTVLVVLSAYFLFSEYRNFLNQAQEETLKRLQAIANTVALQINGDAHQDLTQRLTRKDDVVKSYDDSTYLQIHQQLKAMHDVNDLGTDAYTLVVEQDSLVYFAVTSGITPYYRHRFTHHPQKLLDNFNKGGTLGRFEDENGIWLSAFARVVNSAGQTVAVVEVDRRFEDFVAAARQKLFINLGIALVVLVVLGLILFRFLRRVLKQEEASVKQIEQSRAIIERKNEDIQQSINYARRMIGGIMVSEDELAEQLGHSFLFYRPKDVVSGDFYWLYPVKRNEQGQLVEFYLGVFDCTGHGVPGAVLSMLGLTTLSELVKTQKCPGPAEVLNSLSQKIVTTLKQGETKVKSQDGMDAALIFAQLDQGYVTFAGAGRPLYLVPAANRAQLDQIKGDKMPLGGTYYDFDRQFKEVQVKVAPGDRLYMFSDGYADQFGVIEGKERKIMSGQLKKKLVSIQDKDMKAQCEWLISFFDNWKGNMKQMDDVTALAIEV